ncbi:MAG: hypothetical protein MI975_07695 [Cytophagales bacterium]|nr:hypothetical protein [Cytophagales bacterium]
MKQLTKTTLVVLAIVAGTTAGAIAQKKFVRLDPVTKDLYRLTYINKGECQVRVEVIDESGTKLFSERIKQKKSFTKPYSFQNLNLGEYSFKVIDSDGEYVTKIKRTEEVYMVADIKKIEDEKAKITVRGEFMGPVSVNIFNRNDVLIFDDYIDQEKGFEKVYDLSKVNAKDLRIEVVTEKKLLATAEF